MNKIIRTNCFEIIRTNCLYPPLPPRRHPLISTIIFHFNFEEVEGAYWFEPVCLCVCPSVTLCMWLRTVRDGTLKSHIWNVNKKIRGPVFFSVRLDIAELCTFFDFCIVNLWNLENRLSQDHDIWHIDCVQCVDDLISL